ncbi:DUF2997 domain-containing protein [Candidatus Marithioploca araucensis]|jgi:hypothetical protein|uniref:DUF2997 domain-containing protein n=1 Tax=Candidatus Marithioploca araucensis TaxID=70273 RepID=A0ABT7VUY6_9GAMM|nr:DUF2997 domain-containing protein [Candidatus Marithioploca araucensis]
MPEQRITVTIDEKGQITAKTAGFQGEACLDELQSLLEDLGTIHEVKKTDAYYQQNAIKVTKKQTVGRT